jgi:hypothetical protein
VPDGTNRDLTQTTASPAQPLRDILPPQGMPPSPQAMPRGGTIIRPGAVAWRGMRDARDTGYGSCETIERTLATVLRNPGELSGLFAELAGTRLWVPLVRRRPFTDGSAVRLPLIGYQGADFVPSFTSVQRLTSWAEHAGQQRAGDARTVPHVTIRAEGLALRLPSGLGLALNPESGPGLPVYPECVPFLARFAGTDDGDGPIMEPLEPGDSGLRIGHPPAEPIALLAAARAALRPLPVVRLAARAWLALPGRGEGLLFAVTVSDPASELDRTATVDAIEQAVAAVPLRVPFPVYVTFPGEPVSPGVPVAGFPVTGFPVTGFPVTGPDPAVTVTPLPVRPSLGAQPPDPLDAWIAANTRPFYVS